MRIPNKFNGYRPDGTRNLHDPLTIAGVVGTGEGLLGAGLASSGALASGVGIGSALAGGLATTGLLGELGLSAIGAPAMGGLAAVPTAAAAQIAPAAVAQAAGAVAPELAGASGIFSTPSAAGLTSGLSSAAAPAAASNLATNAAIQNAITQNVAGGIANAGNVANVGNLASGVQTLGQAAGTNLAAEAPAWQQYAAQQGFTNPAGPAAQIARSMTPGGITQGGGVFENAGELFKNPSWANAKAFASEHPYVTSGAVGLAAQQLFKQPEVAQKKDTSYIRPYSLGVQNTSGQPYDPNSSAERNQLTYTFTPGTPYESGKETKNMAVGGPVEMMSAQNAVGANQMYPQAGFQTAMYSNPMTQRPMASNIIQSGVDTNVDPYTGEEKFAHGGIATGLGGYSDGGRLLKGPGDGVSDSIPAVIGDKQPARLADGEFVVPARIVSELGNGSTEAGARKLYAMMDRVQKARGKSVGKGKVAVNSKADKHLPV